MISETVSWRAYLVKTAEKLLNRLFQKKWSSRSLFNLEKELFLGFFTVRKLMELDEVSKEFKNKKYTVLVFPYKELVPEEGSIRLPYEACPSKSIKKTVSATDICNQFIHSHHLIPYGANGFIIGFFVNSKYQSKKGIYMVSLFDIVEIYRECAGKSGII